MVAFDAVGPAGGAGTIFTASPGTWTHVNGGNGIFVGVTVLTGSVNTVTGVTYGGVTVPFLGFIESGGAGHGAGGIALYGLIGATVPAGSNTVSVAFSDAGSNHNAGSVSVSGAGSLGTVFTATLGTTTTTGSVTVNGTTTGGLVVSAAAFGGGTAAGTFSATAPNVLRWSHDGSTTTSSDNGCGGTDPSTGGGANQTVTFTNTQADNWGLAAVEVLPPVITFAPSPQMQQRKPSRSAPALRRHRQVWPSFSVPAVPGPSWSVRQSAGNNAHGVTTLAATLSTNLAAGTKLIAWVSHDNGTGINPITSVKDTAGNSFTMCGSGIYNSGFGGGTFWVLDTPAGDVGATTVITAAFNLTVDAAMVVQEVAGLAAGTTASIDGTTAAATGTATGSAQGPPPYATAAAGEYLTYALLDNGGTTGFGAPAGYTGDAHNQLTANSSVSVFAKPSTGGTETGQFIPGAGSLGWVLVMAAFKAAPPPVTLFGQPPSPAVVTADPNAYTLGTQFSASSAGTVAGVWWWSPPTVTVLPQTIAIYQVTGTSLVVSQAASWSGAAGSGWVYAPFNTPPALSAGTAYKVCVYQSTTANWYGSTGGYWTSGAGSAGITSGALTAPNNAGASPAQSSFASGGALAYPNTASGTAGSNYWVDVAFVSSGPGTQQATASLSGAGTMTLAEVQAPGAALSGTGALSTAAVQQPGVAVSGTGTMTAGGATWGWVQSASGTASLTSSCSVAFSRANLTAGTKIIAVVGVSSGGGAMTCTGVADTTGPNALTKLGSQVFSNNSGEMSLWAMDTPAGDVGIKPVIKATSSAGSAGFGMLIAEVSGLVTGATAAAILDGAAVVWGSGTALGTAACPAFSTTATGELVFAGYGDWGNPTTWTNPAGWTPATQGPGASGSATGVNNAATDDAEICYRSSSGGAEAASYTITGTTGPWITFFAAFKPANSLAAGGATLSGSGTLTMAAAQDPTVALSGTGTMTQAEVQQPAVALSGTGTMTSAQVQAPGASLAGSGVMTAGPPSLLGAGTGYLVGAGSGASGATSYPLAVTGATATGDGVVIVVATGGASPPAVSGVSDSKGNAWTIRQASTPTSPTITVATSPGTAALTTADTITVAYGSAPAGAIAMVAGAASGLSVLDVNTAYATGTSTAPSVSGTPASAGEVAFGCFAWALAGAAGTVSAPFTQLGQGQRSGGAYATLSADNGPASGVSLTTGYTIVSASWRAVLVSFTAASTITGAASLSGSGTLTTTVSWAAGAALSGSGTMTLAETQLATVALAGTGTITAGPPSVTGQGAASLSGTGTLSTAVTQQPGAALSGAGTLSTAVTTVPGVSLAGTGTLTVPAVTQPAVALSGTGTMTTAQVQRPTVALSGTGTLTANVGGTITGAASLSGTGTMTTAWTAQSGAALSGTGTLSTAWTIRPGVQLGGRPGWLVSLGLYIHQMFQVGGPDTAYYFNLPASFAISNSPAATGIQDGFTCTPVLRYTSYAQFQADISASAIIPAFGWVMYDNEYWSGSGTTPAAEYNDPWTYMGSFVTLAHANGLKVILAPARDLGQAPSSVHPLGGLSLDNWYLTWNIPGTAAATGAEVVHVQAQADTVPLSTYTSFFSSAYTLVRASSVTCQVSAGISTTYGAASDMAAAATAVAGTASGFWWNATTATIAQAAAALSLLGGALTTGVPVPESAPLSGTGTLTTAAAQQSTVALSGTGSMTLAEVQVPSVALGGSGTMTSAQVQRPTVVLSGTGSLTATVGGAVTGAASLSGAGSLSTAVSQGPGAALSGSGALSAAVTAQPGAALSGTGTMALAATQRPTVALSGTGALTVPLTQGPTVSLAGSGALSAGYLIAPAVAASGSGTLTTTAGLILPGTAALSGSGTLSTAPAVLVTPAAALSGTGTLTTTIGGTPIFDTDAVRIEDSEFAVLSDPEVTIGTDAGELIRIRDTDSVKVTDTETSAWPHDTDSVRAVDDGGWSGPVADRTPDTVHMTDGGEQIRLADTESASTTDAHVVQVWTYQPPFRWTGSEYRLHYGDRVAWAGPRLDRAAFELADRLAQASTVEWVHDTEQASIADAERFGLLNVQLTVGPALEVTLTIDA